jgi:hypothetical protein
MRRMPTVTLSRIDGARVDDALFADLSARLQGDPPRWGADGSVLIPFTPETPPGDAESAIAHALDSIRSRADWRNDHAMSASD